MLVRKLKQTHFEALQRYLNKVAPRQIYEASHTVKINVNDVDYMVKIQLGKAFQSYVLQALRIDRGMDMPEIELIENQNILFSLLELIINQGRHFTPEARL